MRPMALVNVKLDEEDARRAKALQGAGVVLSALVREAIRAEYARRIEPATSARKRSAVVAEILTAFPEPSDLPPVIDTTDRRTVKRRIATKLTRPAR